MKKHRLWSFLLILGLVLGLASPYLSAEAETEDPPISIENEYVGDWEEPYEYVFYWNNDYQTLYDWGVDKTSAEWKEKFNIDIEFIRADTDAAAHLNLMITSGDLPDALWLDRDANLFRMVEMGLLQEIDSLRENNPTYDAYVGESTRDLLRIDGDLYTIPGWARKSSATGGNYCWLYNKKIWEACGSPEMKTLEDLEAFMIQAKELGKTEDDQDIIPFITDVIPAHFWIYEAAHRSLGGGARLDYWYEPFQGKLVNFLDSERSLEALKRANSWYREGLIEDSIFSDTRDQFIEKLVAGRAALMYFDFSLDDVYQFRQLLIQDQPDNDYIVLTDPIFPAGNGMSQDRIYPDYKPTTGGYGVHISAQAENPQRIFDFHSYLMSQRAAIEQQFGPQGELWTELDDNDYPIMDKFDSELNASERDALGLWFWMMPGHADSVDLVKFAVNDQKSDDLKSWVAIHQQEVFTPVQFMTDEFFGLSDTIDPLEDLGIQRTECEDKIAVEMPKILMAESEEACQQLIDDLRSWLNDNGMPEIVERYDAKYQKNIETQGFTAFDVQ